jgi:FMN phosphatase YigB (HAD superfamily)
MCDYLGISYSDELINKLSEYRIKADFKLKDGIFEGVDRLSKKYKLGVPSNALPSRRYFELKLENLDSYFETVLLSAEEVYKNLIQGFIKLQLKNQDLTLKTYYL